MVRAYSCHTCKKRTVKVRHMLQDNFYSATEYSCIIKANPIFALLHEKHVHDCCYKKWFGQ